MKSAVIGAIVGDIIGSSREFNNTNDYNFELFPKDTSYTDDTVCTIAIAAATMGPTPHKYKEALRHWCNIDWKNDELFPMTGAFGSAFQSWLKSDKPQPYNSFGNGAAMRVSPVGWAFNEDNVLQEAKHSAECTHSHPEGIKGAQTIALSISTLNHSFSQKKDLIPIVERFYGKEWRQNIPSPGLWDTTCQGCVPLAISLFLDSKTFEDAIRKAVCYGGDSDTIASIVGSLAGSFYDIPKRFYEPALKKLPVFLLNVLKDYCLNFGPTNCADLITQILTKEPFRLYGCAGGPF